MGLTIHFEGTLKNPSSLPPVVATAIQHADTHGWTWEEVASEQQLRSSNSSEPDSAPPPPSGRRGGRPGTAGLSQPPTGPLLSQETEVTVSGVRLCPGEHCEDLNLLFDEHGRLEDACKSHPDDDPSVHLGVLDLLRELKPLFAELWVHDEGGNWER